MFQSGCSKNNPERGLRPHSRLCRTALLRSSPIRPKMCCRGCRLATSPRRTIRRRILSALSERLLPGFATTDGASHLLAAICSALARSNFSIPVCESRRASQDCSVHPPGACLAQLQKSHLQAGERRSTSKGRAAGPAISSGELCCSIGWAKSAGHSAPWRLPGDTDSDDRL